MVRQHPAEIRPHKVTNKGYLITERRSDKVQEIYCFMQGCNLECPACQNWYNVFVKRIPAISSEEAALGMVQKAEEYQVSNYTISGGEPTINMPFLLELIQELKRLGAGKICLETNATLLKQKDIDSLVALGITNFSIDLKGFSGKVFQQVSDSHRGFHRNAKTILPYIKKAHPQVFLGIGIPVFRSVPVSDIKRGLNYIRYCKPDQICLIDYVPEFLSNFYDDLRFDRPTNQEMVLLKRELETLLPGIRVVAHTRRGYAINDAPLTIWDYRHLWRT